MAAVEGCAVTVMNTGHGPSVAADHARCHPAADLTRLRRIKTDYDPDNLFRVTHDIAASPLPTAVPR